MSKRNYFSECPLCGAALDPGEKCDCILTNKKEPERHDKSESFRDTQFYKERSVKYA